MERQIKDLVQVLKRDGTFSSSSAWKLMSTDKAGTGFGAPAKKYIKQVRHEKDLGRAINKEHEALSTTWGKFVEKRIFDLLDTSYVYQSERRYKHPSLPWTGAPDNIKYEEAPREIVCDVKCPFSLEVFCDKIDCLTEAVRTGDLTQYKKDFKEDYWQHISNSVLLNLNGHDITHFEAIIYVPYLSELVTIKEMASNYDGDQRAFSRIFFADDDNLPYLIPGMKYKNLNVFQFEIDKSDQDALIARVCTAASLL